MTKKRPMPEVKPDHTAEPPAGRRDGGSSPFLSRRDFVGAGAGLGSALLLPGLAVPLIGARVARAQDHGAHGEEPLDDDKTRMDFKPGAPFVEPEVRSSVNGELKTTLRMHHAHQHIGGHRLFLRNYEGTLPGPTFRVKPGDVLRIKLINDMPPNRDSIPANHSMPHQFNNTNFHSHGLHVSPSGISDNVLRMMPPGTSNEVEIAIPANHPPGTNWYHPHMHGSADVQIASGCVGALIIEGDFEDVPEIAAAKERLLVVTEAVFDAFGMVENFDTLFPETAARFFAVNGVRHPTIIMRPGEVQRWRILHAGWQDNIFMELEGHILHQIARDGVPLSRMGLTLPASWPGAANTPSAMIMGPGQRIDVLVQAGDPGTYEFRGLPYDQGYPSPTGPIATVVVEGEPLPMSLPAKLPPLPEELIADDEITGTRELTFSGEAPESDAAGHWQEFRFFVDGKTFDPNRVDQRVRLGAVEEWTILNKHLHDHVFHIHINDMLVTKYNGEPLPEPIWADTVIVPRFGSIAFRSRFVDFTGKYVLHCHMMNHEELGMMQVVEVYDDK